MEVKRREGIININDITVFDNMVRRNSSLVMSPSDADKIVKWLIKEDRDRFTAREIAKAVGCPNVIGSVYHPAFIRASARCGAVFYVDANLNIRRQRIKSKIDFVPSPKGDFDKTFYLTPDWLSDLSGFVSRSSNVLLIGPAGCGKTTAVEEVFRSRAQKLMVVSCTPSMSADDFEGNIDLVAGETIFNPASPVLASENGYGLLLDDVDAAPPESCYSLYRLLAGKEMHIIRKGVDSVMKRHGSFRLLGTQNTQGRGDPSGLYHGRYYQDEAFLDRWGNIIKVDYPCIDDETIILKNRTGLSNDKSNIIAEVSSVLRKALTSQRIMFCMSMRRSEHVADNIMAGYTPMKAWEFAVLNRTTEEDKKAIVEILQRHYGRRLNRL